jgi:hypothetical protein
MVSDKLEEWLKIGGPQGWGRDMGCCCGNLVVGEVLDESKALVCGKELEGFLGNAEVVIHQFETELEETSSGSPMPRGYCVFGLPKHPLPLEQLSLSVTGVLLRSRSCGTGNFEFGRLARWRVRVVVGESAAGSELASAVLDKEVADFRLGRALGSSSARTATEATAGATARAIPRSLVTTPSTVPKITRSESAMDEKKKEMGQVGKKEASAWLQQSKGEGRTGKARTMYSPVSFHRMANGPLVKSRRLVFAN